MVKVDFGEESQEDANRAQARDQTRVINDASQLVPAKAANARS